MYYGAHTASGALIANQFIQVVFCFDLQHWNHVIIEVQNRTYVYNSYINDMGEYSISGVLSGDYTGEVTIRIDGAVVGVVDFSTTQGLTNGMVYDIWFDPGEWWVGKFFQADISVRQGTSDEAIQRVMVNVVNANVVDNETVSVELYVKYWTLAGLTRLRLESLVAAAATNSSSVTGISSTFEYTMDYKVPVDYNETLHHYSNLNIVLWASPFRWYEYNDVQVLDVWDAGSLSPNVEANFSLYARFDAWFGGAYFSPPPSPSNETNTTIPAPSWKAEPVSWGFGGMFFWVILALMVFVLVAIATLGFWPGLALGATMSTGLAVSAAAPIWVPIGFLVVLVLAAFFSSRGGEA